MALPMRAVICVLKDDLRLFGDLCRPELILGLGGWCLENRVKEVAPRAWSAGNNPGGGQTCFALGMRCVRDSRFQLVE